MKKGKYSNYFYDTFISFFKKWNFVLELRLFRTSNLKYLLNVISRCKIISLLLILGFYLRPYFFECLT